MTERKVLEIAKVILSDEEFNNFNNYIHTEKYNSARLVVDKVLMRLQSEIDNSLLNDRIEDLLLQLEYKNCHKLYDYTINMIELLMINETVCE